MRIAHRHQSLKAATLRDDPEAVVATLAEHRSHCTVLTGTEGDRPELLKANGWAVFREAGEFRRGDPWISWATDIWNKRAGWVAELSDVTYDGRRCHAAVVVLDHWKAERSVCFISTHLPAHIGRLIRVRASSPRERAHNESLAELREMVKRIRHNHPERRIVLAGDLNLDVKSPFVRNRLGNAFRGTGLPLVPVPSGIGGSLKGRLVDWALTDMDSSGDVLPLTDASDHRGVAFIHED